MHWDIETDVVAVGFGAAGAATAIAAADMGASAVVLEKQAEETHDPSARMSGGGILTVNDVRAGTTYLSRCSGGMSPEDVTEAWATKAHGLMNWLSGVDEDLEFVRIGGAEYLNFEGSESVDVYAPGSRELQDRLRAALTGGAGRRLFGALEAAVKRRDVDIIYEAPASRLIRDEDRIVGVEATQNGREVRVRARKGVVLTCGGFEFDDDMKLNYLRASPVHFYGTPHNTGDGVRLAQDVGASLWHMNQMVGRAIGSFSTEGGDRMNFIIGIAPPGYVIVDKYGARFADEVPQAELRHAFYYHLLFFDANEAEYPRIPCYWIFDERRRTAGPLTYTQVGLCNVGRYSWSDDNSEEITKGWIAKGRTPEEAAQNAGHPHPEAVAATVEGYNKSCSAGVDAEFGRSQESLVPLDSPPYYCIPLYPGGSNTSGGPRRDRNGRILDAFGEPIPGLYGAGELGQVAGLLYPADGANLSDAMSFGQIAVEHALSRG